MYTLSIDQGTTSTTLMLLEGTELNIIGKVSKEFPQYYPKPGLVEHDLNEIWETTQYCLRELIKSSNIDPKKINSIGITNQRETICFFNKTGDPLEKAIVWQDKRTSEYCQSLKNHEENVRAKTGLPIDPYFSASKIHWGLNNSQKIQEALKNNNLLVGTIDTFLLFKLTNGEVFATEPSNASRTLLFNIKEGCWDKELLDLFQIPLQILPEVKDSIGLFGNTHNQKHLPDGIAISGILGDQQAALFGQGGISQGAIKCTYGTGAFMLLNTGQECLNSDDGLLSTVAFKHKGKTFFALEGSSFIAGAAIQWLRDNLNTIENSAQVEEEAKKVSHQDMENLLFFPFFSGIGSPYWVPNALGAIVGMTRDTRKEHLSRAALDGIALSISDLFESFRKSYPSINELKVDGGMVANTLFLEITSSSLNIPVLKPKIIETTAYGAALAAFIGHNNCSLEIVEKLWKLEDTFTPDKEECTYLSAKKQQWANYIKKNFL